MDVSEKSVQKLANTKQRQIYRDRFGFRLCYVLLSNVTVMNPSNRFSHRAVTYRVSWAVPIGTERPGTSCEHSAIRRKRAFSCRQPRTPTTGTRRPRETSPRAHHVASVALDPGGTLKPRAPQFQVRRAAVQQTQVCQRHLDRHLAGGVFFLVRSRVFRYRSPPAPCRDSQGKHRGRLRGRSSAPRERR